MKEKKEFTGFSFDMLSSCVCVCLKRKELSNRTIGPSTWSHTQLFSILCDMKWSKLCSGICFDEDEQILHQIFVQSFLYDVIYYIILLCLLLQVLNHTRRCTSVSVNGRFFFIEQNNRILLAYRYHHHNQIWILGHCFRFSFTILTTYCCCGCCSFPSLSLCFHYARRFRML